MTATCVSNQQLGGLSQSNRCTLLQGYLVGVHPNHTCGCDHCWTCQLSLQNLLYPVDSWKCLTVALDDLRCQCTSESSSCALGRGNQLPLSSWWSSMFTLGVVWKFSVDDALFLIVLVVDVTVVLYPTCLKDPPPVWVFFWSESSSSSKRLFLWIGIEDVQIRGTEHSRFF